MNNNAVLVVIVGAVLASMAAVDAKHCRSTDLRTTDKFCMENCNNEPPFCPEKFCTCEEGPTWRMKCKPMHPTATEFWCEYNCNTVPPHCPESYCSCHNVTIPFNSASRKAKTQPQNEKGNADDPAEHPVHSSMNSSNTTRSD